MTCNPGDRVRVHTRVYALSLHLVRNAAHFTEVGALAKLSKIVDSNTAIVMFSNGFVAPVHPSALEPVPHLD